MTGEESATPADRPRRLRRLGIVGGVALLALAAGAGAVYAYDAAQGDVIARGISVGGVDVGGLSAAAARARLRRELWSRFDRPLVARYRGKRFTVTPGELHARPDVEAMVDAALARSRRGNLFSRFLRELRDEPVHAELPTSVTYSRAALDHLAKAAARKLDQPARNARVKPGPAGVRLIRSRTGARVDAAPLERALAARIVDPDDPTVVPVPVSVVRPHVTTAELAERYPWYITVDRAHKKLHVFHRLKPERTYTIAVGMIGLQTPAGLYHIQTKVVNPAWNVPNEPWAGDLAGRVIPPGSPDNPLKARWLGFSDGAGIHGTDDIASLGTAASHGCIRMSIPDVVQLYRLIPLHTPIYIG
jgi:lipoprotein-anchoring transpeptidase ErfK/SrfK